MKDLFNRITKDKQLRILTASMKEFAKSGFENANINQVAKDAGVSVGSMYKYFESKQDLFLTTVKHCSADIRTALKSVMCEDVEWPVKVEKIIHIIQGYSRENKVVVQLYNIMTTQSNSSFISEAAQEVESLSAEVYQSLIQQAQKEHFIRNDCDSKMLAFLLDNLFMMLQFSYACDYYRERFKVYVDYDILRRDDFVAEEMIKFIKGAFTVENEVKESE
ncbi:MAG TPA: TetR/AcrR family transcriptional regulator [Caproicibacter sp.]|nr:TetR/AcrR family transcriptional regulator [Caproicibacter sp.]